MGFATYKQADSRWGKKNYNGSSSMATAGCGPTSCANIIHALNSKITPVDTMKYMQKHGYAIRNNGTAWNGIPACLKAFGMSDARQVNKMYDVWNLMSKGYVGIFLFRSGSRGGVTWTTSGHYVAVTDYKAKNGKHYLYTRDSGGRNHTGWYCYETQMKGLIPRIWLCKFPTNYKPPKTTLKRGSKGTSVKTLQQNLNNINGAKLSADGDFGPATEKAVKAYQKKKGLSADGIVGSKTHAAIENDLKKNRK